MVGGNARTGERVRAREKERAQGCTRQADNKEINRARWGGPTTERGKAEQPTDVCLIRNAKTRNAYAKRAVAGMLVSRMPREARMRGDGMAVRLGVEFQLL